MRSGKARTMVCTPAPQPKERTGDGGHLEAKFLVSMPPTKFEEPAQIFGFLYTPWWLSTAVTAGDQDCRIGGDET
jgi:hypothetical protein